ncbi:hypothetical protein [Zoogloea sp. 1C4]|uniref:hypothetical protein n=1 Tax=Zoogloea sp. 1C4 TaxID=2570190 RepID=UPI001291DAAE|nr:hypothetical protein [Zoogloea sp. 1C4]
MANTRGMLARLRKLERANGPPLFKFIGSPEEFEAHAETGIAAGWYDPRDMPLVLKAIRRWLIDWL